MSNKKTFFAEKFNRSALAGILLVIGGVSFASGERYVTIPQPVQRVPPGTRIADGPPTGWSHLVIKSVPRCVQGDRDKVPKSHLELAGKFHHSLLVNVGNREGQTAPSLTHIAVGISCLVGRREIVVTPETQKQLGAQLGFFERLLLSAMDERQGEVQIVLFSRRMAIVDVPTAVRFGGVNQIMVLRYLLTVDAGAELRSFVCLLQPSQGGYQLQSTLHELVAGHVEDSQLYVDKSQYTLGMPNELAFAIVKLPQATVRHHANATTTKWLQRYSFTEQVATSLELFLSQLPRERLTNADETAGQQR